MVDGLEFFNALAASARDNERLKSEFPDFEKQLKDILSTLKDVANKFKDGYAIKSSETAMETLRRFMVDSTIRAKEQDTRSKALHDMAEAMIPQVTDAQMQAYRAQKQAYDAHEKSLKAQTDAIVKAANAQTKAVQKEADAQIKLATKEAEKKNEAIDRQVENEKKREAQIAESLKRPLDAGERLSKVGGEDTLLTQAFSGFKDMLGERKAQDDKAIVEAFAPQKEAIQEELAARKEAIQEELAERKKAIEEEKDAQIAATKEAMAEIAKAQGIVKPEDPRKLREAQVAEVSKSASRLKGIENAAPGAIAAEAASMAEADSLAPASENVSASSPIPQAASAIASAPTAAGAAPKASLVAAGGSGGLGSIAKAVGTLSAAVGKFQPFLAPVVQILSDIDSALPVVSTGVTAIADSTRVLGSTLFSVIMDLGGYLVEGINAAADKIDSALSIRDTRRERIEKAGDIQRERNVLKARREAEVAALEAASSASLSTNLTDITGGAKKAQRTLLKVEPSLTTPAEERAARTSQAPQAAAEQSTAALQQATQQMIEAQERAAKRQAQVGLGTTPLIMSNPYLESFPA